MKGRCLVLESDGRVSKGVATTSRVMLNCYILTIPFLTKKQSFCGDYYQFFVVQKSPILQVLFVVFFSSRERDEVGGLMLLPF